MNNKKHKECEGCNKKIEYIESLWKEHGLMKNNFNKICKFEYEMGAWENRSFIIKVLCWMFLLNVLISVLNIFFKNKFISGVSFGISFVGLFLLIIMIIRDIYVYYKNKGGVYG